MKGMSRLKKRLRKKKENQLSLVTIRNLSHKKVQVYIKKKHWNKGDPSRGFMTMAGCPNDYITMEEVLKRKCRFIANFQNVTNCRITIFKSKDNRNHIKIYD